MRNQQINQFSEVLAAPLGDLISSVGRGVAEAQRALDQQTIENFRLIYQEGSGMLNELRALGYQPTWYTIPEVEAEIRMSLSIQGQANLQSLSQSESVAPTRRSAGVKLYASTIDANFTNRYDYNVQGSSTLRFRIVPVPPSPEAEILRFMPQLVEKTLEEAITILTNLGIRSYDHEGMEQDDFVAWTEPAAGDVLLQGELIRIRNKDGGKDDD